MKAYWIKVDIDGEGERWRLAVERPDPDGEGGTLITIIDDRVADDFTDDAEHYADCPRIDVVEPREGDELSMGGDCRRCRVCGCTDDDCSGCIERTGEPCFWIEDDLCSACSGEEGKS
jgi:hypothetical protein